jgi:hypothetical protein
MAAAAVLYPEVYQQPVIGRQFAASGTSPGVGFGRTRAAVCLSTPEGGRAPASGRPSLRTNLDQRGACQSSL